MLALIALLAATSPNAKPADAKPPDPHLKVLVLDVNSTDMTASEKTTLTNLEAAHSSEDARLEVLSGEDLRELVKLQGQAADLGVSGNCTDACMAELAGALGAGVVIATQAGKLGDTLVVTLAVFDAAKAKSVSRKSIQATALGELPAKMGPALDALVTPLLPGGLRHDPEPVVAAASSASAAPPVTSTTTAPPPSTAQPTQATPPDASTKAAGDDDGTAWLILGVGLAVGAVMIGMLIAIGPNGDDGLLTKHE